MSWFLSLFKSVINQTELSPLPFSHVPSAPNEFISLEIIRMFIYKIKRSTGIEQKNVHTIIEPFFIFNKVF